MACSSKIAVQRSALAGVGTTRPFAVTTVRPVRCCASRHSKDTAAAVVALPGAAAIAASAFVCSTLALLGGDAQAAVVTAQPQYQLAGIVEKSKGLAKDLQRRSDETFNDINTSPSKTGNPEDALRPDLQQNPLADKVRDSATKVADTINAAPAKALKGIDNATSGPSNLKVDNSFNTFRQKQAAQADAVGKDAREKSKQVFSDLQQKLKGN